MLSRIAESLFWIGRYVERAEDTARILDVHVHHLLEAPIAGEENLCRSLLEIMGMPVDLYQTETVTPATVTELLAFDWDNPGSIVASLAAARSNARGVSEAISSEMWEALNITYNGLPPRSGSYSRVASYPFFRYVRERAAIIGGLVESTMSRDDAWRFMVLGRSLERVDMLARLLSAAAASADVNPDWVVLLRSWSAHEAFLRTYRREPDPELAAEFLLLDRLFPRSVFRALSDAEERLAELDPRSDRTGTPGEARRILGNLRTHLEFRRIDELMPDLAGLLGSIQNGCSAASAAVASRHFRETAPIEWSIEGSGLFEFGHSAMPSSGPRSEAPR